jgi:hypothetical protein
MTARSVRLLPVLLLPLIAFGQQAPPPEVEQALRARVTEFLQYHVDGNFRKAYDMVAEDTKDRYFNTGKVQLRGFKIDDIKFADDFTKASVTATMSKTVMVVGQEIPIATPSTITWKIENGKWVWYDEPKPPSTPLGFAFPSPASAAPANGPDNGDPALPKDFNDQTIAAAARSILQQVSVDKKEITLAADKASEERVVFHNGMPGSVQVELTAPEIPGFSAKVEPSIVRAAADVPVVFRYEPGDLKARPDPINVQLMVQPLNQLFVIRVNFAAAAPK